MHDDYAILYLIILGAPFLALVVLVISLLIPGERWAAMGGVIGAPLGFVIGVSLGGGFGQTEGWGWGNVGAAILGINYAGVGALLGIGCCWLKWNRVVGAGVLVLAAIFPLAHVYFVAVRPAVSQSIQKSQMEYWRPILINGYLSSSEDDARDHFSDGTRKELEGYVGRHSASGTATPPIPPSTLKVLYDLGIGQVASYQPLPPDLAQEIYDANPRNDLLAMNPGAPEGILLKFADSDDPDVLRHLSANAGLPESVARKLEQRFEQKIAAELSKPQPDYFWVNCARDGLKYLAMNPRAPEDMLKKFADSNDPEILFQLARNKNLPDSLTEKLQQRFEAEIAEESKKPKPNNSTILTAKMALGFLARRSSRP